MMRTFTYNILRKKNNKIKNCKGNFNNLSIFEVFEVCTEKEIIQMKLFWC